MALTVLLTLGRLPKALDLARALSARGARVVVAEPHGWHLCRVSRAVYRSVRVTSPVADQQAYLRDLLRVVIEERVDLVVPVSEESMHVAALRALLPAEVRLASVEQSRLLALHDKLGFIRVASRRGLPVPESHPLGTPEAARLAAESNTVCKPRFGCGGRGVRMLRVGEPLPAVDPGLPRLVQCRLEGETVCGFAIARAGALLGSVQYRPRILSGTVAVAFQRLDPIPAVADWMQGFVAAEQHDGFIAFDFIVGDDGVARAIECNPRATSGVHFFTAQALSAMLLDGEAVAAPYRAERLLQQFFPTLTEWNSAFRDWAHWRTVLGVLVSARDVTWQWSDPLPLLTMPVTAAGIIWQAARRSVPFGEVATLDIDYHPDQVPE
jgi:hypothetical protein